MVYLDGLPRLIIYIFPPVPCSLIWDYARLTYLGEFFFCFFTDNPLLHDGGNDYHHTTTHVDQQMDLVPGGLPGVDFAVHHGPDDHVAAVVHRRPARRAGPALPHRRRRRRRRRCPPATAPDRHLAVAPIPPAVVHRIPLLAPAALAGQAPRRSDTPAGTAGGGTIVAAPADVDSDFTRGLLSTAGWP